MTAVYDKLVSSGSSSLVTNVLSTERKIKVFPSAVMLIAAFALVGCAGTPKFDTTGIDASITPQRVIAEETPPGKVDVLWGGMILSSKNLKDTTELEVLAYPLAPDQEPDPGKPPLGRFLAVQGGFLETADFAQGRNITIRGTLDGIRTGQIGEADYRYPLVRISQIHLWPLQTEAAEPRVRFGIGVGIHK